jgi:hypothetical protein
MLLRHVFYYTKTAELFLSSYLKRSYYVLFKNSTTTAANKKDLPEKHAFKFEAHTWRAEMVLANNSARWLLLSE